MMTDNTNQIILDERFLSCVSSLCACQVLCWKKLNSIRLKKVESLPMKTLNYLGSKKCVSPTEFGSQHKRVSELLISNWYNDQMQETR